MTDETNHSSTNLIIIVVAVLAVATIIGAATVAIFKPEQIGTAALIVTFSTSIIGLFFALYKKVEKLAVDVNSRLTQLVEATKLSAHAQGVTDEREGVRAPTTPEIEQAEALKAATEVIAAPEKPNGDTKTIVLEAKDMHVKAEGDVNVSKEGPQADGG